MSCFTPRWDKYDVVILDYNGDRWPEETDKAFIEYVQKGGGVIVYHAADNAFAGCTGLQVLTLPAWYKDSLERFFPGVDLSRVELHWL